MSLALAFDTETTGIPLFRESSDDTRQPHVVQLAAILFDQDTGQTVESVDVIVRPDGWDIPAEVTAIHGITTEQAHDVGVSERLALDMFLALWAGRNRIAHNQSFDKRIIRIAAKRYADESTAELWKEGPAECTGHISRPIMKMPGNKMPKLTEAYEFFIGEPMPKAWEHTAMGDTKACLAVYQAIKSPTLNR